MRPALRLGGKTVDQIPIEWCYGPGVIVDLSDMLDELGLFGPQDIEARAEVRDGDILFITPAGTAIPFRAGRRRGEVHPPPSRAAPQHLRLAHQEEDPHLGRRHDLDRPPDESADRPLSGPRRPGALAKVRAQAEEKFGTDKMGELFPDSAYQLTHNALFPHNCMHVENLGGDMGLKELHNKRITLGVFPWKFKGGEAAFCRAVAFTD